jgi:hypothetical protein
MEASKQTWTAQSLPTQKNMSPWKSSTSRAKSRVNLWGFERRRQLGANKDLREDAKYNE